MKKRPLSIVLIALFYVLEPVGNVLQAAFVNDLPVHGESGILSHLVWTDWLILALFPVTGVGIYMVRRWGWYLFIAFSATLIAYNLYVYSVNPNYELETVLLFIAVVTFMSAFFLKKHVYAPYFNPRLRWWESAARYRVSLETQILTDQGSHTCTTVDISETGCFVSTRAVLQEGSLVMLKIHCRGAEIDCMGKVVRRSGEREKVHGYGIMFQGLPRETRRMLRLLIFSIKRLGREQRSEKIYSSEIPSDFWTLRNGYLGRTVYRFRSMLSHTLYNPAKDKAINHLSHELQTPVAVLTGSLEVLSRKLQDLPDDSWKSIMVMAEKHLERLKEIQFEAQDIMADRKETVYSSISRMFDHCADELAVLIARESGGPEVLDKVRRKIDEVFGAAEAVSERLQLDQEVQKRLEHLKTLFAHRNLRIAERIEPVPQVFLPKEALIKIIDGLVRNGVENTPDEGEIEVEVLKKGDGSLLRVRDSGIGIPDAAKRRIFEGFFSTRDMESYSSKRPFDFGAGGKGADLLRMKIFSDRYGLLVDMASSRCRFMPEEKDECPGQISKCRYCSRPQDCYDSGGAVFSVYFPPAARP
jgi:signal transduction histidine kinase